MATPLGSLTQQQKLRILYKQILREAQRFPSKKRDAIIEDIRAEWRTNAAVTDPAKVAHSVEMALRGLETLRKYTRFDRSQSSWSVQLEQDPLGAGHPSRGGGGGTDGGPGGQQPPAFEPFGSSAVRKLE